jgi:hypothetical protein
MRYGLTCQTTVPRCIICGAVLCTCKGTAGNVEVPIRRPGAVRLLAVPRPPPTPTPPPVTVTTVDYPEKKVASGRRRR